VVTVNTLIWYSMISDVKSVKSGMDLSFGMLSCFLSSEQFIKKKEHFISRKFVPRYCVEIVTVLNLEDLIFWNPKMQYVSGKCFNHVGYISL